jgi:hypothetical protein
MKKEKKRKKGRGVARVRDVGGVIVVRRGGSSIAMVLHKRQSAKLQVVKRSNENVTVKLRKPTSELSQLHRSAICCSR